MAMKKTNEIREKLAKAELIQADMDIMSKKPDDLPDDISRKFLRLRKQAILDDLQEEIEKKNRSRNDPQEIEVGASENASHFSSSMAPSELDTLGQSNTLNDASEEEDEDDDPNDNGNVDPSLF